MGNSMKLDSIRKGFTAVLFFISPSIDFGLSKTNMQNANKDPQSSTVWL